MPHPPFIEGGVWPISLADMGQTDENHRRIDHNQWKLDAWQKIIVAEAILQEALYVRQNRNIRWYSGAVSGRNVILGIVLAAADVANLNQSNVSDYKVGDIVIFGQGIDIYLNSHFYFGKMTDDILIQGEQNESNREKTSRSISYSSHAAC